MFVSFKNVSWNVFFIWECFLECFLPSRMFLKKISKYGFSMSFFKNISWNVSEMFCSFQIFPNESLGQFTMKCTGQRFEFLIERHFLQLEATWWWWQTYVLGKPSDFLHLFSCVSIVHCVSCPDLLLHPSGKSVYGQILCYSSSCHMGWKGDSNEKKCTMASSWILWYVLVVRMTP